MEACQQALGFLGQLSLEFVGDAQWLVPASRSCRPHPTHRPPALGLTLKVDLRNDLPVERPTWLNDGRFSLSLRSTPPSGRSSSASTPRCSWRSSRASRLPTPPTCSRAMWTRSSSTRCRRSTRTPIVRCSGVTLKEKSSEGGFLSRRVVLPRSAQRHGLGQPVGHGQPAERRGQAARRRQGSQARRRRPPEGPQQHRARHCQRVAAGRHGQVPDQPTDCRDRVQVRADRDLGDVRRRRQRVDPDHPAHHGLGRDQPRVHACDRRAPGVPGQHRSTHAGQRDRDLRVDLGPGRADRRSARHRSPQPGVVDRVPGPSQPLHQQRLLPQR